jgi:hypothetical protein
LLTQLELPQVGERKIMGVLGFSIMSIVRANSVSVEGATIPDLRISATTNRMTVSKVRGVLGQYFLQTGSPAGRRPYRQLRRAGRTHPSPAEPFTNSAWGRSAYLFLLRRYYR